MAAVVGLAAPAAGAEDSDKLQRVEEELAQKKHQQEALDAKALEESKNLADLRARMIASAKSLQDKETEQENLKNKLAQLEDEIDEKSKSAEERRRQLALMASVLVEIASRPPESLFLHDRVMADHIHRSVLLRSILPRLKQKAESAVQDIKALYELKEKLARHKKLVAAARVNLESQQKDLDQMIATRQGLLKRTEGEKAALARRLAALAAEARDLRQLMEKVAKPQVQKSAGRGIFRLVWPVAGAVRKSFGEKDADGVRSEGLTLAAPSGAPVVAPYAGKVVFAGPFRGYGQIMILQHDNGYHTFLSGFGRIDAEMAQEVDAGEPLGVLPVKDTGKPELYFEWRSGDRPVDPLKGLDRKK